MKNLKNVYKQFFNNFFGWIFLCSFFGAQVTWAETPFLRIKTGVSSLNVTAGERLSGEPLKSMVTFQPTVLWDMPSFSSRIGIHYMQEMNSPYGLTPISGIGVSGYYHILGISSVYEMSADEVLIQKSRPGPYIIGSFTPLNVNLNKFETGGGSSNFYFSAFVNEIALGMGYDYPILQNMILSAEFLYRNGNSVDSSSEKVNYSGYTLFLTVGASYY